MNKTYLEPITQLEEFARLVKGIRAGGTQLVSGCIDAEKALLAYALADKYGKRAVILCENDLKAKQFFEDFHFYHKNVYLYPAIDLLFYQADVSSGVLDEQRAEALRAIASDRDAAIVLPAPALMDKIAAKQVFTDHILSMKVGMETDLGALLETLAAMGYERTGTVYLPGQFALRGDILDIYSMTAEEPVRIEFFGDEIEAIRTFDVESQLKIEDLTKTEIYPGNRVAGKKDTLLSYFASDDTLFFLDEPARIAESLDATETEYNESVKSRIEEGIYDPDTAPDIASAKEILADLGDRTGVALCGIAPPAGTWNFRDRFHIDAQAVASYNNSFSYLVSDLSRYVKQGYRVLVLSASRTRASRMADDLIKEGLSAFYTEDTDRILSPVRSWCRRVMRRGDSNCRYLILR